MCWKLVLELSWTITLAFKLSSNKERNLMLIREEESVRFSELVGGREIASAKRRVKNMN